MELKLARAHRCEIQNTITPIPREAGLHLLPFFLHRSLSTRMPAPFRLPPKPSSSPSSGIVAGSPHPLPLPLPLPASPVRWLSPPSTAAAASAALRHCSVCTRRRRSSASSASRAASDALSCSPVRASRAAPSFRSRSAWAAFAAASSSTIFAASAASPDRFLSSAFSAARAAISASFSASFAFSSRTSQLSFSAPSVSAAALLSSSIIFFVSSSSSFSASAASSPQLTTSQSSAPVAVALWFSLSPDSARTTSNTSVAGAFTLLSSSAAGCGSFSSSGFFALSTPGEGGEGGEVVVVDEEAGLPLVPTRFLASSSATCASFLAASADASCSRSFLSSSCTFPSFASSSATRVPAARFFCRDPFATRHRRNCEPRHRKEKYRKWKKPRLITSGRGLRGECRSPTLGLLRSATGRWCAPFASEQAVVLRCSGARCDARSGGSLPLKRNPATSHV
uniref:Uncharacterized protein n=1 Tax=Zea mays TaxID=4577 RepID=A0A804R1K5_MAIZE